MTAFTNRQRCRQYFAIIPAIFVSQDGGSLRTYLGAAPGVGKTYAMLRDGHRLRSEGRDVVIGLVKSHGRLDTECQALAPLRPLPVGRPSSAPVRSALP